MDKFILNILFKLFGVKRIHMKKLSSTAQRYTEIAIKTGNIYMIVVSLYLMFSVNGWDPISYVSSLVTRWIPNNFGQILVQVCTMFITAKVVYDIIYEWVKQEHFREWLEENKDIYIDGTWLHIHDKEKVRTGDVIISQDFYTISVDGHNIALPNVENKSQITIDKLDESDWNYTMAKIVDDEGENTLHGYYASTHGTNKKTGVHTLTFTSVKGFPIFMSGTFHDLVEKKEQKKKDSLGDLRLYKLTEDCFYYDKIVDQEKGRVNYKKLLLLIKDFYIARENIVNNKQTDFEDYEKYLDDPYMSDITDIIKKHGWFVLPSEDEKNVNETTNNDNEEIG